MEKTPQKVTKNQRHVEAAHKGRKNYMNKLKESILNDAKKGSENTSNTSNETTSATNTTMTSDTSTNSTATTRSSDTYAYGVGILAVLAIGACVFFAYNTFQPKDKKLLNEKWDQPSKQRHML